MVLQYNSNIKIVLKPDNLKIKFLNKSSSKQKNGNFSRFLPLLGKK